MKDEDPQEEDLPPEDPQDAVPAEEDLADEDPADAAEDSDGAKAQAPDAEDLHAETNLERTI